LIEKFEKGDLLMYSSTKRLSGKYFPDSSPRKKGAPALLMDTLSEIRVTCPPVMASYLEELLWTLPGVESVSEHYRANPEQDETRPSDLSAITVLLRPGDAPFGASEDEPAGVTTGEAAIRALLAANPRLAKVCAITESRSIAEADWADQWKQYWHPTRITERLTICPTWEEYVPSAPDERVIRLDPESAFGTGAHETTRLMLQAMETLADTVDFSGVSVLDVGTGSGILAIDAALRGCRDVRGVDNDAAAVEVARKNACLNGVESVTDFTDTPLADLCRTRYDIVLVNIIAPVILELWPDILLRLNPGGHLLASGLIEKSVGTIESAMREAGFVEIRRLREDDWFALHGVSGQAG
jgi:ribosomal protein L11 methyltransferase